MTNGEYIASLLLDENSIDDGGASFKNMVNHNIECPYFDGYIRCPRNRATVITREVCFQCKVEWLESEVDE